MDGEVCCLRKREILVQVIEVLLFDMGVDTRRVKLADYYL